jgi:hypothetical protein
MQQTIQRAPDAPPAQRLITSIIFNSIFLLMFGWSALRLYLANTSFSWPSVQGQITKSVSKYAPSQDGHSAGTYTVDFEYKYSVNGKDYTSHDASYSLFDAFPGINRGQQEADQFVEDYPASTSVAVYYDPHNPQTAILKPGATGGLYYLLAFSTFVLIVNLLYAIMPGLFTGPILFIPPVAFFGFVLGGILYGSHTFSPQQTPKSKGVADAKSLYEKAYQARYHIKNAEKVEGMYEQAIAAARSAHGGPSVDEYDALNGLASYCEKVEPTPDKAISTYERADKVWIEICNKVDWQSHPLTIHNLAELLNKEKGEQAAVAAYENTAKKEAEKLGANHPLVQNTLSGLAGIYTQNGHYAKTYPIYSKMLVALEKTSGKQSAEYGRAEADFGDAYLRAGDKKHALPLLTAGYKNQKNLFGDNSPIVQWAGGRLSEASK